METAASSLAAPAHEATAADKLIVALDFPSAVKALSFVDSLEGRCRWFKVGMELFYASGAGLVHTLREQGCEVFLDLKLHDIPNTVAAATRTLSGTGASLLTIHAAGGERMMAAAAHTAQAPGSPKLLAVTVLTSMDELDLRATGVSSGPGGQALRLAQLAQRSGISGMVCSANELQTLRSHLTGSPLLVVPAIRPSGAELGDQRRTATPSSAIRMGASMLVIGRPITQAAQPAWAAQAILDEMDEALQANIS